MSACQDLVNNASAGVAASLRAVDCVSNEATASAFSRLFGLHGALLPALTILLTLYVASFAILLRFAIEPAGFSGDRCARHSASHT